MSIPDGYRQIIKKCQASAIWFLRNFGKVKHTSAGIIPFEPFTYQRHAIECFRKHRLTIFRKCRQSGISKIAGAFALWFGMFHPHKTILIVSRTDDDAMNFLRDHITFLFEHLPRWMRELWKPVKKNDHEIIFPNGSKIRSLTSHPDVLRSNASSLNIIDEAAFIQNMDAMWAGGWPCQVGDTLIATDDGLVPIADIADRHGPEWQDISIMVATDDGYKPADRYHIAGYAPTISLTTALGYWNEGTDNHRLRTIDDDGNYVWRQLKHFRPGDVIVSMPGQFTGKRRVLGNGRELTPELAYIIGLCVANGHMTSPGTICIIFDRRDSDLCDHAVSLLRRIIVELDLADCDAQACLHVRTGRGTLELRLDSAAFIDLLSDNELCPAASAADAVIPQLILRSDRAVLCSFLRGLFDISGWCLRRRNHSRLGLSTESDRLAKQVQTALHALGIIARRSWVRTSARRDGPGGVWQVIIHDAENERRFADMISFISQRKRSALTSHTSTACNCTITNRALIEEFLQELHDAIGKISEINRRRNLKARVRRWRRRGLNYKTVAELSDEFGLRNRLSAYVRRGLYFDVVVSCTPRHAIVYDISVPSNNTYIANGIVSHNTLQHGGNVIVISTTNGMGNWYWATITDAEAGINQFHPITINWWDMDWVIEYVDPLSKERKRIAPRDGIRNCDNTIYRDPKYGDIRLDPTKYGPYWSPWLEEQYRALQERGEAWKFEQEILANFVGSGNTVLPKEALSFIHTTIKDPTHKVKGLQTYVHPVTGNVEELNFDFDDPDEGLWIWAKPVTAKPMKKSGDKIIEPGTAAHSYVMGVDIATGRGRDYSAIEVFDVDTREQVAEFMARCLPRELVKYIDRIGRWYNCALAVIERNNGGDIIIDSLRYDVMYPRLWRKKDVNDKPKAYDRGSTGARVQPFRVAPYGFCTTSATKQTINKFILDYVRDNAEEGYVIYSRRLLKQFQTYVRKRDRSGRDTMKTEAEDGAGNYDDLVMACGLAFVGVADAFTIDSSNLLPVGTSNDPKSQISPIILSGETYTELQKEYAVKGGPGLLMPMIMSPTDLPEATIQQQLEAYTIELGGIPISQERPTVTQPRFFYERKQ